MKIRGNTVGTSMKRPDFNQTDPKKSDFIKNNPIPIFTEEDEGKILRVSGGKVIADTLEVYGDAVTVDEGASGTFDDSYEEGYTEGYEQGKSEGGGITEDWVRKNFLPIRTYDSTSGSEAVVALTPEGKTKLVMISNGNKPDALVKRESDGDIIGTSSFHGYKSNNKDERALAPKYYVDGRIGEIETVLDNIIEVQEALIGGDTE